MRLNFCLALLFTFAESLAINNSFATQKDLIALDLLTCLNFLDACKKLAVQAEDIKIKDRLLQTTSFDLSLDLRDSKVRPLYLAYQEEFIDKIKTLLTLYRKTKCGLNRPNFWQIYNQCLLIENNKMPHKALDLTNTDISNEKSLMNLAQKMVLADAAKCHDESLKLLTLFRDSNGAQLQKLLQESFTLDIAMTRAFRKTKATLRQTRSDSKTSFLKNLVCELKKGYWRDEELVATIRYIYQYILYEFSLAKNDHRWSKSYRLLRHAETKDLAQQLLANFIYLYIVSPFLMDRIPLHEIKKFAQVETLAFNFDSKHKPSSFSDGSPIWHELITLIIGKSKNKLRTNSLKTRNSRFQLSSSRSFQDSMWSSSSIPDISALEIIAYLNDSEDFFANDPTRARQNLVQIKNLLEIIAKLPDDSVFRKINEEFYFLQQIIRQTNFYDGAMHDHLYLEAISTIFSKMEQAKTWRELVIFFEVLVKLNHKHPSDLELNFAITELAHLLTDNMQYLEEEDLTKLLHLLSRFGKIDLFNRLYQFAVMTKNGSHDPKNLLKNLSFFSEPIDFEPSPSSWDPSSWASRKNCFVFKYRDRHSKISLPEKGVKELSQILRQNPAFKDAPWDILAMIAKISRRRHLEINEVLYQEGNPLESFALMVDGDMESISNNQLTNGEIKLSKGQFIPKNINVFDQNKLHLSTIKAIKPADIYEVSLYELNKLFDANPRLIKKLFKRMAGLVYRQEQSLAKLLISKPPDDFFIKLLEEEVLVGISILGSLESNEALLNQNAKACHLYWVESGHLLTGPDYELEIPANNYLNQIAFLAKKYHPYSVKAGPLGCGLVSFSSQQFFKVADDKPHILSKMAAYLLEIINKNDDLLRQTDLYRLQCAIEEGDLDVVKKITTDPIIDINWPCPIEKDLPEGTRPIHLAARYNHHQILDYLLKRGAEVDGQDNLGNTAAHIAAYYNHLPIFKILKFKRANFWIKNHYHETPFEVADSEDNKPILDFLRSN